MKVRAKRLGYYDLRRRREGDEFTLKPRKTRKGKVVTPEQQFSGKWMELVDPKAKAKPKSKKKDESEKAPEETEKVGAATGDQEII